MFARTKRLTLRPGWPEDAAALHAAIAHEAVAMRLARVPWPYRLEDAAAFLALPQGADEPRFVILSHEHDYPRLIGGIGLTDAGEVRELGYWLTPSAWGRGYATEAAHAVVAIAEHALRPKPLRAFHQLANSASGRVLEKVGFRVTGVERRFSLARGQEVECAAMEREMMGARVTDLPIAA